MKYAKKKFCENEKDVNEALVSIKELNAELTRLEIAKLSTERQICEWEDAIRIYVNDLNHTLLLQGADSASEKGK